MVLVHITNSECYLSKLYTSSACIQLVIETYKTLLRTTSQPTPVSTTNYIIPANVFTLLANLRSEYLSNVKCRELYLQQIEMNNKSTSMMTQLIAKTDIQLQFINFINTEFKDILTEDMLASAQTVDREQKLRDYLKSKPKSSIKKCDILEEFPDMLELKTMKLNEIITKYKL